MVTTPDYWPGTGWTRIATSEAIDLSDIDEATDQHQYWAPLDPSTDAYGCIKGYVDHCILAKPAQSSLREITRMNRAGDLVRDPKSTPLVRAAAERRLREGQDGGPQPPRSQPITIRNIRVVRNLPLWQWYSKTREGLLGAFPRDGNALRAGFASHVTWSAPHRTNSACALASLPEIDRTIGECMLFHGTTEEKMGYIVVGGFRPDLGIDTNNFDNMSGVIRITKPHAYGFSGQATYFSDSFGKTMTYGACPKCLDYECGCRREDGRQHSRYAILARVLLGRIDHKFMARHLLDQKKYRRTAFHHKPEVHSVYTKGYDVTNWQTMFQTGCWTNEFAVKRTQFMYPEFIIEYVPGRDDLGPALPTLVRQAITRYRQRRHFNQSKQTKDALRTLETALERGDLTRLLNLVHWYLGKRPVKPEGATDRLKPDSSFFKDLNAAIEASAYRD